jgi:hypothetical protein
MIIEGTFFASVVDIVAKKLVDIFGARADSFFDKDEVRAASYTSYKALRRMDDLLGDVEKDVTELHSLADDFLGDVEKDVTELHSLAGPKDDIAAAYKQALARFQVHLSLLAEQLQTLKTSFSAMQLKMEIYQSLEEAASVELAMASDGTMINWLFDNHDFLQLNEQLDELSLFADMKKSIEDARRAIAAFIKNHYKIEQKESGR